MLEREWVVKRELGWELDLELVMEMVLAAKLARGWVVALVQGSEKQ
jgi:hypothetical protein